MTRPGRSRRMRTGAHRAVGDSVAVAGLMIHAVALDEAADAVIGLVDRQSVRLVVTVNVDQALNVADDREVAEAFSSADLRLADGFPVVTLSKLLGTPLPARVTGADLLPAVCARAASSGCRVVILGGAEGVPEQAARRLRAAHEGLDVVVALSPPLGFENDADEDARVLQAVVDAHPDIVFVCLGSPKQELWVWRRRHQLPPAVYLGVGAAVDFAAGTTRRAPQLAQRAGLEWLWRLVHDRRLARRYLVRDPRFVALAARELRAARRRRLGGL